MPISGAAREVQLVNVLQIHATRNETLRVTVEGRRGAGVLFMDRATIVHARYGDLEGHRAVHAVLSEADLHYLLATRVEVPSRSCEIPLQQVLLAMGATPIETEAPQSADDGTGELLENAARGTGARRAVPDREDGLAEAADSPARSARLPLLAVVVAVLLGAVGLFAWQPWKSSASAPVGAASTTLPSAGPERDGPASVLEAVAAQAPEADAALVPTVIVSIEVDASGGVAAARIERPRADLADWEAAALEAVNAYRFTPARRDGRAVASTLQVAVEFDS